MSEEFEKVDIDSDDVYENTAEDLEAAAKKSSVFKRVSDCWHKQSVFVRVLLVWFFTVFVLIGMASLWIFAPILLRWKFFASAAGLLGVNILCYLFIHWKKRVFQTVLFGFTSIIMCALMIFSLFFWTFTVKKVYNYDDKFPTDIEQLDAVPVIDNKITNIALFGIDTRTTNSFSGNSDSIMIMSLDSGKHTVKIISIMRDSLVPIERNNSTVYSKINSAYARGGPELAVSTLNKLFGLDITEYATVNFFGMSRIIDAVGGIDVELTEEEVSDKGINSNIVQQCKIMGVDSEEHKITKSGLQHLNGIQAVGYSRIRNTSNAFGTSNDYGRTDRQRYVMEQLFNKALTMSKSRYPSLITSMIPYTVTSLSPDEILDLALTVMAGSPKFYQARIPHQEYLMPSPSGSFGSVVYYDLDFASELIHSFVYEDITFEDYVAANGISKNDWYSLR